MLHGKALPLGTFVLGVLLTAGFFYMGNRPAEGQIDTTSGAEKATDYTPASLAGSTEITCTYPQILSASYRDGKVNHSLPKPETNPMIFTFSYDDQSAKLKYIDATRTISETPIIKIHEDNEKVVFVEGTGENYLTTHTVFKKAGVSLYAKEVDFLGIPAGSLAMGTCVGL